MDGIMDQMVSETQNRKRIKELEKAFSPSGMQLSAPGRDLIGEGELRKHSRRKWEPKVFLLFTDILVYGSVVVSNRWYKNPKILPLKDIKLEDLEDSEETKNQWLISTPRKSFYVSALCNEQKKAWMSHIETTQRCLLLDEALATNLTLASTWIPDRSAQKCMRCLVTFTATIRRHHCRKCGFVVCNACSKGRALMENIDPKKPQRICKTCNGTEEDEKNARERGGSAGSDLGEKSSDDE